jgi:uncharacterized ion transporter superfamily protein YfcC
MRLRFPHPLVLLTACVLLAAALTRVLPAGEFDRRDDPATGRRVVVAGTYHAVPPSPIGLGESLVAIPKGMADAGAVVFFVFLVGGAFTVVDRTGALRGAVEWLVARLGGRGRIVLSAVGLAFAAGGALEHTKEETIAIIPVVLLLTGRLGFDAVTAVAISIGAAFVGAAFSPIDPFQVGIAQKLAELPLLSGSLFRLAFMAPALAFWIGVTIRHAERTRVAPIAAGGGAAATLGGRQQAVLALVLVTFAGFVVGVMRYGWGFDQMSALFLVMGVAAGLVGGLRVSGTADAYVDGFRAMAYAGLLIGFARAIYVVLEEGRVVDTIVRGLFAPLEHLPLLFSALGMTVVQAGLHVVVPSPSGQAVLTMPVLVPLSDLLGLQRQVTVLAFQFGAGLCELLTPTNGALMAVLAAAGLSYERWLRFLIPRLFGLYALGLIAVSLAIAIGLR